MNLIEECPVLYPSEKEFLNFEKYIEKIGLKYNSKGILKIIPPKSWKARSSYEEIETGAVDFPIQTPIEQNWVGQRGIYRQVQYQHRMNPLCLW